MKKVIRKSPKLALCRECSGSGVIDGDQPVTCPQCEGSGRVMVGGTLHLEIRAYKPE